MEFVQYNWFYALISIIIFMVMLWAARPDITYTNPCKNNINKGLFIFFFLYIINSVLGLWAEDTYHIWDGFIDAGRFYYFKIEGYESIYNWLASITGRNYFLWRFIIWTPACLFMYLVAKKFDLLNRNFLVSLVLFGGFLAFTRGMLGHAMLLYGLTILICSNVDKTFVGIIVGLLLVVVSYFFHKSMYINIIFVVLAMLPFGKNTIRLSILLFPVAIMLASMTVESILAGEVEVAYGEGVGGVGDRTMAYLEAEKSDVTFFGYIGKVVMLLPIYFTMFYLYNRIYIKKYFARIKNEIAFKYFYRITYVAVYISSAYLFLETSEWISSRFMYMSYFPMVFVLGKVWSLEPKTNNYVKFIILSQLFALLYVYLNKIVDWYAL